jgi:uncharacterized protein YgbK (DUF1537 family)
MRVNEKSRSDVIRRKARRLGYRVRKSRAKWATHANLDAGYMLIKTDRNCCVLGSQYEATLNQIDAYLHQALVTTIDVPKSEIIAEKEAAA